MPEYLSPGVYIEEVSTGPRPIEGVSTSTAGFVGVTERGPEYPLLVTSWMDYQRWYGSYLSPDVSILPYAVQGFFDNGGQRLFIARVVPGVEQAAGMTAPTRAQATIGDLTLQAVGRGDWGNRIYYAVEQASKAKATTDVNSPVKKWIKVTLLHFKNAPKSKDFQAFNTAQQAASLEAGITTAANQADIDATAASTAVTNLDGDPTNVGLQQAARTAVNTAKASTAQLATLTEDVVEELQKAKAEAEAALAAKPGDAGLIAAKNAVEAAFALAQTALASAKSAKDSAEACAADDPPTSAIAAQAATDAGTAKTDWGKVVTPLKTMNDAAFAAYPVQAAQSLAAQAQTAAAAALQAVQAAQQPMADSAAAPADVNLRAAGVIAVAAAIAAAQQSAALTQELKNAADNIAALPGMGANPAVTGLITQAQAAVASTTQADTDAQACDTDPFVVANGNTAVGSATTANTDVGTAVGLVGGAASAVQSSNPVLLAVNPMVPENRLNPDFRAPDLVEVYDNLRIQPGASNSLVVSLGGSSQLVVPTLANSTWNVPLSGTEPGTDIPIFTALAGGGESSPGAKPTLADFLGSGDPIDSPDGKSAPFGTGTGLAGLAAIEGISLLAAPDEATVTGLSEAVINQCELLRDRFGVVSSPNGKSKITEIIPTQDTTYAAFYYPWIWVFDPVSNGPLLIPPTGHVTGLIARTDIDRGVHKAPANEVLRDAFDLEYPIPKGKQDILNPKGVNCVRDFRPQGRSIRVWGARTMTSDPEWKYINVRRLFIFVEQSILRGTQWVVFEPNDELLWTKVRLSISAFLTSVWKSGALMGTTADEAFFVRCDRTTMTQNDIDNGRLVCLIGIAPVKPAEFVIFRISQKMQEVAE